MAKDQRANEASISEARLKKELIRNSYRQSHFASRKRQGNSLYQKAILQRRTLRHIKKRVMRRRIVKRQAMVANYFSIQLASFIEAYNYYSNAINVFAIAVVQTYGENMHWLSTLPER